MPESTQLKSMDDTGTASLVLHGLSSFTMCFLQFPPAFKSSASTSIGLLRGFGNRSFQTLSLE